MTSIVVSIPYDLDYYYLPGSWWISGPARDGWDGSASYRNAGPPPGTWQDDSKGFGFSFDEVSGRATILLPTGYIDPTGSWTISCMKGAAHGTDPARPYAHFSVTVTDPSVVCDCTPVVSCAATDKASGGYKLNVKLDIGDCNGPMTNIVWAPLPDSGQGTDTAVYNNRSYNTIYNGSVSASCASNCVALADFGFRLGPGPNSPSCS